MFSIIIKTGIRRVGVPSGRKCPNVWVGWFRKPIKTVANQRGIARAKLRDNWVVGVKVYGNSPSILMEKRNTIREANKGAHL